MKLSVIIPMKNEEKYIGPCLSSISNNNFPVDEYEIICIDNGSGDRTVEIAKNHTDKVYLLPGVSISALRNFGAKNASGDFLAFVDADCLVDVDWMEKASVYLDDNTGDNAIACFGSTPAIPDNATWVEKTWHINKGAREHVQKVEWLESMNLFVKRTLFLSVGGFNEELETCEDVDLCYRVGNNHDIISDRRIRVVHLGEAKSLLEFFKKELWRGRSNLHGFAEHGFRLSELPSIMLPVYYLLTPVLALISMLLWAVPQASVVVFLILFTMPAVLIAGIVTMRAGRYDYFLKAAVVYLVYFSARAIAVIKH